MWAEVGGTQKLFFGLLFLCVLYTPRNAIRRGEGGGYWNRVVRGSILFPLLFLCAVFLVVFGWVDVWGGGGGGGGGGVVAVHLSVPNGNCVHRECGWLASHRKASCDSCATKP